MKEALKLALEALENHTAIKHPQQIHYRDKAITAIKEALAQEQEPVEDVVAYHSDGTRTVRISPKRTWVGLTDEEIMEIAFNFDVPSLVVRTVEAKLKDLNT